MSEICSTENSHIETVFGDFCHWNAGLEWHETKCAEDDESSEEARSAVYDADNDRVSASIAIDSYLLTEMKGKWLLYIKICVSLNSHAAGEVFFRLPGPR